MPVTDFFARPAPPGFPRQRPFIKMQGLRNHFVFLDERRGAGPPQRDEVVRICDVHEGVGAEQVIGIAEPSAAGLAAGARCFMRIYNIDGTEAAACGNATRCMAALMFEETGCETVAIETVAGVLPCSRAADGMIGVTLGPIDTRWERVPLSRAVDTAHLPLTSGPLADGFALSMGNPHVVFFVPDVDAVDIPTHASAVAADPLLPEGANIGVAQVLGPSTLRLAVWERPGMLTEACGTGACAAAFAGRRRGLLTDDRVSVLLPGGTLKIELLADGRVVKTGPAEFCFLGYF